MKKAIVTSGVLIAGALFSLSASANPGAHGAVAGRCDTTNHSNTADWDCVEWKDTTQTGSPWYHATEEDWFGPDSTNGTNFAFTGPSELVCFGITLDCTLTLNGQARINTQVGDDFGIKVVDGSVSGGGLCGTVNMDFSTPWYADEDMSSGPWTNASYIPDPGTLNSTPGGSAVGSIGNIAFTAAFGTINISDGVMYGVEFHNNGTGAPGSYFAFDGDILVPDGSGGLEPSGCQIVGDLYNDDINAW